MRLPHLDKAVVDRRKVVDYLLAVDHPEGAGKAYFFIHVGFKSSVWRELADALLLHASRHTVEESSRSKHGTKYVIEGPLACPNGQAPIIRSIWIIDSGTDFPRLVTAYPV